MSKIVMTIRIATVNIARRRNYAVTITDRRRSDVVVRTSKIVVKISTRSTAIRTGARSAVVKTRVRRTVARNETARVAMIPGILIDKTTDEII